jgi:hypothetical protein
MGVVAVIIIVAIILGVRQMLVGPLNQFNIMPFEKQTLWLTPLSLAVLAGIVYVIRRFTYKQED